MLSRFAVGSLGLALVAALTTQVQAKTLVFCSEGSPEGFNPQLYTSGTTFDASSRPIYNRLVEFERGTTKIEPAWPRAGPSRTTAREYIFKLRPGVKFQTTKGFTPTRDFNADDVVFIFERMPDPEPSLPQGRRAALTNISTASGMPDLLEDGREGRRPHGEVHAQATRGAVPADLSMDFASILSAEYADQMLKAGTPEKLDLDPVGTGPVPARRLPEGRGDPLQGQPRLLGAARPRSTISSSRSRPMLPCAGRS